MDVGQPAFELGTDGPNSILVGVDGSEASLRAGAYAAGMARRQGSRLTVVFARPLPGVAFALDETGVVGLAQLEANDAVEAELRERLRRYVYELAVGIVVRRGPPFKVITGVADEVRAEAIVVGSSRPGVVLRPGGPLAVQLVKARRWPVIVVP